MKNLQEATDGQGIYLQLSEEDKLVILMGAGMAMSLDFSKVPAADRRVIIETLTNWDRVQTIKNL